MGERVTVEGTVENVIFHNEENGYTVLLLTVEGEEEPVTVVGCIPCAAAGEGMTVTGVWSVHPVHGSQLTAESVERRMPEREEDMIAYLSSGILKGVGPATAQRLVERFGTDTLLVIEREPERLRCIKGITAQRAKELSDAFRALTGLRQLMEFLARYDLPVYLAMPLQRTYGDGAIQALRDDPYILSRAQYGVDFSTVDEIAISLGFGGDDPCRLRAALTYELEHNAANGHVFLPREKLLFATSQMLAVTPDGMINLSIKKAEEAPARPNNRPMNGGRPGGSRPNNGGAPRAARPNRPAQPAGQVSGPSGDAAFEDRLKQFMQESDSRMAGNRLYNDRSRGRRRGGNGRG